jgi:hypothetical protein
MTNGRSHIPQEDAVFRQMSLVSVVALASVLAVGCERNDGQNQNPNYANNGPNGPNGYNPNGYPNNGGYNNQPPPGGYPPGYQPPPNGTGYNPNNPAPYPSQPGTAPAPYPSQPGAPAPNPSAPGTAPAPSGTLPGGIPWPFPAPGGSTNPPPGGSPGGASTGSAQAIDPALASVATVPLTAYAAQQAQGMTREGTVIAGNFKEGQTLEQPMQILPNKCYTVLAVGAGPQEVDISLIATTPIPQASPVLAQDQGSGSNASLGGGGNCFKWSFPVGISAKYVIKATKGQGVIAAQLYSK